MPSTRNFKAATIPRLPHKDETIRVKDKSNSTNLSLEDKFELLSVKLDEIIQRLDSKDNLIGQLQTENTSLRKDLKRLEDRIDNIENYDRRNDVILSGNEVPAASTDEDLIQTCIRTLKSKVNYSLSSNKIAAAFRLGKKPDTQAADRRSIMIKLHDNGVKRDVISSFKTLKPQGLYVNENLIQTRSTILYLLRAAKRKCPNKISYCGSQDGKVYILMTPPNPTARKQKVMVNSLATLELLYDKEFGLDSSELAQHFSRE